MLKQNDRKLKKLGKLTCKPVNLSTCLLIPPTRYYYIESTLLGAGVTFILSHIACYKSLWLLRVLGAETLE